METQKIKRHFNQLYHKSQHHNLNNWTTMNQIEYKHVVIDLGVGFLRLQDPHNILVGKTFANSQMKSLVSMTLDHK